MADFDRDMELQRKMNASRRAHDDAKIQATTGSSDCGAPRVVTVEDHIWQQIAWYERMVHGLKDLQRNLPRDFLESPRDRILALTGVP